MYSVFDDYNLNGEKQYLYIFPIERLQIKNKEKIGDVTIYPSGYLNIDVLLENTVYIDEKIQEEINKQLKYFRSNTLLVFSDVAFHDYPGSVVSDEQIIKKASQKIDCIIDFLKFKYCHFSNSKNLPGRAGQISTGESLLFMIHVAYPRRIISKMIFNNILTIGNGLNIQEDKIFDDFKLLSSDIAEVGNFAKHALKIYSSALEESSDTNKFIQIMRLFEFIAFPKEFAPFKKIKEEILSHVAENNSDIQRIRREFKEYTSGENNDGLRTEIIHNGKLLEDIGIYKNPLEREYLFDKFQRYLHCCIDDLISNHNKLWTDIEIIRSERKKSAERNKNKSHEENCAKSITIIDGDWLGESIKKYTKIYKEIYPDKNFKKIKFEELCWHALSNTRALEENRTFLFYVFYSDPENISYFDKDIVCFDRQNFYSDKLIFQFHVFNLTNNEDVIGSIGNIICYLDQDKPKNTLIFKNIVFCGDREEYKEIFNNTLSNGNKNVVAIRDSRDMKMDINIPFFHVGQLVGFSLGLSINEL